MYSYGSNPSDVHITYSNNTQHNMENSQEKVISTKKNKQKILIIELFSNKKCCTKSINNDTNYPNS